jgi:hypothetical protein
LEENMMRSAPGLTSTLNMGTEWASGMIILVVANLIVYKNLILLDLAPAIM